MSWLAGFSILFIYLFIFKDFIYLLLERRGKRKKGRENIDV